MEPPRTDYLSWYDTFMYAAVLFAMRSKDPNTQVGACIIDEDNKMIGVGYNGLPRGCRDVDFPWSRSKDDPLGSKYMYVVHAEKNAISNSDRPNLKGCKIFVTHFPCNECAKDIIQSGIREVYYYKFKYPDAPETIASLKLFEAAGITLTQYTPTSSTLLLELP